MSLFPFNFNKHSEPDTKGGKDFWSYKWQGSPIDFRKALELADRVFLWHLTHGTSDWTQSSDGAEEDKRRIALGLMALLAEPGTVKMIGATGEHVERTIGTILENIKLGYINRNLISLFKELNLWQASWDEHVAEGTKRGKQK